MRISPPHFPRVTLAKYLKPMANCQPPDSLCAIVSQFRQLTCSPFILQCYVQTEIPHDREGNLELLQKLKVMEQQKRRMEQLKNTGDQH